MCEALLLTASLASSTLGMAWLALGMKVHWEQVFGHRMSSPVTTRWLRSMGGAAVVGSLMLCLAADHASMAVLVWIMSLAASALIIAFTLTWRAHRLAWVAPWLRR